MAFDDSPRETDRLTKDFDDTAIARRGCFPWMPYFGGGGGVGVRSSIGLRGMHPAAAAAESLGGDDDPWWMRGWKKVREWSEIVAGPRWKTFLRRFNRDRHNRAAGNCFPYARQKDETGRFRYDELSYALNFDEGRGQNGNFEEDGGADVDFLGRDFSSRYASVPASSKSSMDLGPSFT